MTEIATVSVAEEIEEILIPRSPVTLMNPVAPVDQPVEVKLGTIPPAYALLGAEIGYKPLPPEALRFFILGRRFEGKSTFLAGRPRTLILDAEAGAWGVPDAVNRAVRIPITTRDSLDKIVDTLVQDAKNPRRPFDHIGIDTIDRLIERAAKWLGKIYSTESRVCTDIRQWGQKGAGYSILTDYCWSIIARLEQAGYSWSIIGHLKEKDVSINNKEITVVRPVLYDMLKNVINDCADVICKIEATTVLVDDFRTTEKGTLVKVGTKESNRIRFSAEVTEIGMGAGAGTGKLRGVASLNTSFLLPDFNSEGVTGWDRFVQEYEAATAKVRRGQFS